MDVPKKAIVNYLSWLLKNSTKYDWQNYLINETCSSDSSWTHKHVTNVEQDKLTMFVRFDAKGNGRFNIAAGSLDKPFNGGSRKLKELPLYNERMLIEMIIQMIAKELLSRRRKRRTKKSPPVEDMGNHSRRAEREQSVESLLAGNVASLNR